MNTNPQRNVEVDKAVLRLAQNVFATVERCAQLHPSPSLVMLENFHYLQHELSLLKLPQLEAYRKEAQGMPIRKTAPCLPILFLSPSVALGECQHLPL